MYCFVVVVTGTTFYFYGFPTSLFHSANCLPAAWPPCLPSLKMALGRGSAESKVSNSSWAQRLWGSPGGSDLPPTPFHTVWDRLYLNGFRCPRASLQPPNGDLRQKLAPGAVLILFSETFLSKEGSTPPRNSDRWPCCNTPLVPRKS